MLFSSFLRWFCACPLACVRVHACVCVYVCSGMYFRALSSPYPPPSLSFLSLPSPSLSPSVSLSLSLPFHGCLETALWPFIGPNGPVAFHWSLMRELDLLSGLNSASCTCQPLSRYASRGCRLCLLGWNKLDGSVTVLFSAWLPTAHLWGGSVAADGYT